MSPSEGRPGRARAGAVAVGTLCALAVLLTACSRGSPTAPSASVPTTSPGRVWLAVLDSADDPNQLDGPYGDLVASVREASVTHLVVSPSACYSGLPPRYDGRYVLGVWDATEQGVRALIGAAAAHERWIGAVESTCVD